MSANMIELPGRCTFLLQNKMDADSRHAVSRAMVAGQEIATGNQGSEYYAQK